MFDRIKQYGFHVAVTQISRALVRKGYHGEHYIVFIIPDFEGYAFDAPCIVPFTKERIVRSITNGELDKIQARLLTGFIEEGSKGICAEVEGKLAGYAWIQFAGSYSFGQTGKMIIPPKHAIVKNLLVFPEYRGGKFGQKLNAARLSLIPKDYTPVAFIIPVNRYAIRNWEKYGFRSMLKVRRWCWLGGHWKMQLTILSDRPEAIVLETALKNSNV